MAYKKTIALLVVTAFFIGIPVIIHTSYKGAYVSQIFGHVWWIGPISSSIPFVFLALLFLAQYPTSPQRAYCGALLAWLGMMVLSLFIISQQFIGAGNSTIGIAVGMTTFLYLVILLVLYLIGSMIGSLLTDRVPRS